MPDQGRAKSVSDVVQKLLKSWGLDVSAREQMVFHVWDEVMGEAIAKNARPAAVFQGHLVVAVKDSAWMQELQFVKADIRKKLNKRIGKGVIKDVRFKLGSWEDDGAGEPGSARVKEVAPEVEQEAREAVSVIRDPKLRERMYNLLISYERRAGTEGD